MLNKVIKLFNFKKDLIYESFDEGNEAAFETGEEIIKNFVLDNKKPKSQRNEKVANIFMSKNFVVIEEKDHSYITSLKVPETYTIIEAYEPSGFPGISPVWIKDGVFQFIF